MHDVVVNDEPLVVTRRGAEPMVVRERIAELNAGNGRLGKMIEDDDVRHNAA
jgi:hypothetical protein